MGSASARVRSLIVLAPSWPCSSSWCPGQLAVGPPVGIPAQAAVNRRAAGHLDRCRLPTGWQPTSCALCARGRAMTWLAGYQAPSATYVSVEQTKDAGTAVDRDRDQPGRRQGHRRRGGAARGRSTGDPQRCRTPWVHAETTGELATLVTARAPSRSWRCSSSTSRRHALSLASAASGSPRSGQRAPLHVPRGSHLQTLTPAGLQGGDDRGQLVKAPLQGEVGDIGIGVLDLRRGCALVLANVDHL